MASDWIERGRFNARWEHTIFNQCGWLPFLWNWKLLFLHLDRSIVRPTTNDLISFNYPLEFESSVWWAKNFMFFYFMSADRSTCPVHSSQRGFWGDQIYARRVLTHTVDRIASRLRLHLKPNWRRFGLGVLRARRVCQVTCSNSKYDEVEDELMMFLLTSWVMFIYLMYAYAPLYAFIRAASSHLLGFHADSWFIKFWLIMSEIFVF